MTDIEKFKVLHDEYMRQRERMIKLLEYDCKRIGVKLVARELKVDFSYLYRVFEDKKISYEKILELFLEVESLKKIMGVFDD